MGVAARFESSGWTQITGFSAALLQAIVRALETTYGCERRPWWSDLTNSAGAVKVLDRSKIVSDENVIKKLLSVAHEHNITSNDNDAILEAVNDVSGLIQGASLVNTEGILRIMAYAGENMY